MSTASNKTLLLTGFEPFGEHALNPTELIVQALDGEEIGDCTIKSMVLPVVFGESGDMLIKAIAEVKPDVVLCLGLAADRQEISVERLAVNLDDAEIPDNAGKQPTDHKISADGPGAYWSSLPVKNIVTVLNAENIPAALSMSAGTFVCNHVFYRLMESLEKQPEIKGGFIHIPPLQEAEASGLEELTKGIRLIASSVA